MKVLNKIRMLGAAAALLVMTSPLAQAAGKTGLNDVIKAQELMAKEPAVQYSLKGTFFTPLGIGTITADGQVQDTKNKKSLEQMKVSGKGKANLVILGTKNAVEKPFEFYAIQNGDKLEEYGSDGKTWKKHTVPYTSPTEKDIQKGLEDLKKNAKSAKVISDKGREKVIDVTLDSQKLFMADKRNDKTASQKAVKTALKKMDDLTYRVVLDKKTGKMLGLSMDMTPVLQTSGREMLEAAAALGQINPQQQEMAQALLGSSTLKFEVTFAYDKGTDIVLPDAAKNAAEGSGKKLDVKTAE